MTEEYDEEVVFENSPLFQYLQDLGHTDFEACPTVSQEEEPCAGGGEGPFPQEEPCLSRDGLFWSLADALWRQSFFHQGGVAEHQEQQLDADFRQYSLRTILEQDVLLQEDVELIELLDPSILSAGSSSDSAPAAAPPAPRFLATPTLWDLAVLAAFVAVLVALRSAEGGPGPLLVVPWLLALAAFLALRGAGLWRTGSLQRRMCASGGQLRQLAQDSRALTGLARKSLRLLQETEVISRGFTLVSAACPFSRAGHPRSQQLLGLRKASYRTLRSAFRASRLATCHMLKSYPMDSEIDNVTNYVSTVPLKELGLGLGAEHLTDEQVQELTDDYSLPALKVVFQLWVGQSSEFFRRLALLLSPGRDERREGAGDGDGGVPGQRRCRRPAHQVVAEVTGPLVRALSGCLGNLRRSYDFHRYFETQRQSQGSGRARVARQKCRELNSLHASVRSLQLHLKALLNEMIILEDELEKLMVSRETTEVTDSGYQELQDRLRLLQPHMQASSTCWDDTVAQVERMLRRAGSRPDDSLAGTPGETEENASPLLPTPPPKITFIQDRDPVPEEQELEAYVSDSDSDEEWRGPLLDLLSPEERERQRREREESRRVLLELKSVLGMRASDKERQKWKQLLFSDQAALNTALPPEPTEPQRPSDPPDQPQPASGESDRAADRPDHRGHPDPPPAQTEFSCGSSETGRETARAPAPDGKAETLHYQYDGSAGAEPGAERNGADWPFVARVPAVTVMDRLTELHGSATLSFSSALAAQVAARSHAFANMEEQTFGDEEEEEEEEEGEREEGQEEDGQEEDGQGLEEDVMSQPRTSRQTDQD
ncbi:vezatin isoform X2 [Anguilla anguilla]|uniref:vezatin isoform X2 n=1 Tax=Anguilla anguilla TaxID=7936 RepID=UPI0015B30D7F|nr:vezatin isoform X2 [Anguilla anguilla]